MIGIKKNHQDVKIFGFVIANFNHNFFLLPLYCKRCTVHTLH